MQIPKPTDPGLSVAPIKATDFGLKKIESLLKTLADNFLDCEVVFNDFGVLRVLRDRYDGLKPIMGRLLVKITRDPRIMNILDILPEKSVEYYRTTNLTIGCVSEFLRKNRINRVEVDNVLQGLNLNLEVEDLRVSIHTPYIYVTTTRLCLIGSYGKPNAEIDVRIEPCKKECQRCTFKLENPAMPIPLIRKGNTVFYINNKQPPTGRNIDRIVFSPEIPI